MCCAAISAPAPQIKLAVVLVVASVVSAAYYLGVIATMFMQPVAEAEDPPASPVPARMTGILVGAAAILVLVFGVFPAPVARWAEVSTMPLGTDAGARGSSALQASLLPNYQLDAP